MVGEGAAGKTSLIRALCGEASDDHPSSTIGISQSCVELEIAAVSVEAEGGKVKRVLLAQLTSRSALHNQEI